MTNNNLKIAITGHTEGIGKEIYDYFELFGHNVKGFARANGYDLSVDYQKVIELSYSTLVMSIPSFVFFIVLPILLKFKQNFVFSLFVSIISTAIAYAIFMFIIKKFNFNF